MVTAEEDIQLLIKIIKHDLEIQKKERFLASTPGKIAEIEKSIRGMDENLQKELETVAALESEKKDLESKVKLQNSDITKKKLDRENLKTNKEYKAMGKEIDYLINMVDKEEERILIVFDRIVEEKKELEKIQAKIMAEKDTLIAEKTRLEDEMGRENNSLAGVREEKLRILPLLSEKIRNLYNRILNAKGDSGVANLAGDICQGCYSRMPPQKAHEIRRNDSIITCEYCGRILVYYETE
ncbi:MAG: hypothetical protein JW814_08840 [Candidatus Krumholzibacteriota bacterium]|nr:hypothetical protein [Candidatus Krumholzibacteriota bacterium]